MNKYDERYTVYAKFLGGEVKSYPARGSHALDSMLDRLKQRSDVVSVHWTVNTTK